MNGWDQFKHSFTPEGSQALMANPMFNVGMGLLAHRQNADTTPFGAAIMGGMLNAQQQKQLQEEQSRIAEARTRINELLGMTQPGNGGAPATSPGSTPGGLLITPGDSAGAPPPDAKTPGAPGATRMAGTHMGVIPMGASAPATSTPPQAQGGMPADTRQMLGILGQLNPELAVQEYMGYAGKQQALAAQNNPMEQFLRMYGNVNPHDFTGPSIQRFHDEFARTGRPRFDLLEPVDDLSTKEQGFLHDAITDAQQAEADIGRMGMLAGRFDEQARQGTLSKGFAGSAHEWLKNAMGGQDEALTQLRTEYEQLKVSNIVQDLPPGVASDKDVELVLKTWPPANANPAYIGSFLRGMQKLRAIKLAQAQHRYEMLSRNNNEKSTLEDWNATKDWRIQQALDRVGGINTMDPDAYWRQYYGSASSAAPAAPTTPTAPANATPATAPEATYKTLLEELEKQESMGGGQSGRRRNR